MKTTAAAIDFGTSKIVTVLAESGGFSRCDIIGSGAVPYDGYMDGAWNSPDKLVDCVRKSIAAAEIEAKQKIREIFVGVPCEYIHVRTADAEVPISAQDGRVADADIDAVQDAAADKLSLYGMGGNVIHRSPAWFSVDGGRKTMSPLGAKGSALRALTSFIIADPAYTEEMRELFKSLNITVNGFLAPVLGEALLLLPLDERDKASILIDVGYLNTEFSVVEGDALTYHAVLPIGGGHITANLVEDLMIPLASAEVLKRAYIYKPDEFDPPGDPEIPDTDGGRISFPRELVQKSVEAVTDEIAEMLDMTIKDCQGKITPRTQIFMTGGGINSMRGSREYLAEKLGRPVKDAKTHTAKLNGYHFGSTQGLVDLVFDSIEQRSPQDDTLPGRLVGGIKNLFNRG